MKYLKRCFSLFKLNTTVPFSGLSNELLCILAAQEAAKLPEVKFRDLNVKMKNVIDHKISIGK